MHEEKKDIAAEVQPAALVECFCCGTESEHTQAFRKIPVAHRPGDFWHICPACWEKKVAEKGKSRFNWLLVMVAAGSICLYFEPLSEFGFLVLNAALFEACMILSILPHELGHAFAAKLVGFRVFRVKVGIGKTIYRRKLFGFDLRFAAAPFGGHTLATPRESNYSNLKYVFYVSAGLAIDLVIVAVAFLLLRRMTYAQWTDVPWSDDILGSLAWPVGHRILPLEIILLSNLYVIAINLWPREIDGGIRKIPTDGLALVRVLFHSQDRTEEMTSAYYCYESFEAYENQEYTAAEKWCDVGLERFPKHPSLLNLKGAICIRLARFQEARDRFCQMLKLPEISVERRYLAMNNIAYADALLGGADLLQEADEYSRETVRNCPWVPQFKGTRGSVLVELGQLEEGLALLHEAFEKNERAQSKALNACHIAVAERKLGHVDSYQKYIELARRIDPSCFLLPLVEEKAATDSQLAP